MTSYAHLCEIDIDIDEFDKYIGENKKQGQVMPTCVREILI